MSLMNYDLADKFSIVMLLDHQNFQSQSQRSQQRQNNEVEQVKTSISRVNSNSSSNSDLTSKVFSLTGSFGKCKVCCDIASGIHYGIATCEGCKGFYKRSLEKHTSYFCFYRNNCLINKISRNRCKLCRYKKCIKEGMSVKGIRKGRIPKAINFSNESSFNSISNHTSVSKLNTSPKIKDYSNQTLNELLNTDKKSKNNSLVDINHEKGNTFHQWLQNQIDTIKKTTLSEMTESQTIDIIIDFEEAFKDSHHVDYEIQNILKHHQIFEAELILPNTMIKPESELIIISLLKDKVYQIYKRHILNSSLTNNSNLHLNNKIYIDKNNENMQSYEIWINFMETISEFTKWLTRFAKELPGFNRIDIEDFSTMLIASVFPLFTIQVTPFIKDDENYTIINNNIQFTKKRMIEASEKIITNLLFEFHHKFQSLNLTEQELCLFYPFILTSCNVNKIKDKNYHYQLKSFYMRALLYQFELNNRDELFKNTLYKIFQIGVLIELNKKKF